MTENRDSPICKALEGRGAPDPDAQAARIPEKVTEKPTKVLSWSLSRICQGARNLLVEACWGRMWSGLVKILMDRLNLLAAFFWNYSEGTRCCPWRAGRMWPLPCGRHQQCCLSCCHVCPWGDQGNFNDRSNWLIIRLQLGGFQWQNSIWRQLLLQGDLEDMGFSSKYSWYDETPVLNFRNNISLFFRGPVDQPCPQHLPLESSA